jgi:hypothetical protein
VKHLSRNFILLMASLVTAAGPVAAAVVKAPPLPPGSQKVKLQIGMDPLETARAKHAHKKPKKDKKLDDTRTSLVVPTPAATPAK